MEENKMNLCGMEFEPKELWDILFFAAVRMQIERENYKTTEERGNWLESKISLCENIMQRLPFHENGVTESLNEE